MHPIQEYKYIPFTLEEYQRRLNKVRSLMEKNSIDILMINDPVDLNYLLGYRSWGFSFMNWQALIISLTEEPIVVTRKLESTNYYDQTCANRVITFSDDDEPIKKTMDSIRTYIGLSNKTMALSHQSAYITPDQIYRITSEAKDTNVRIVDSQSLIEKCRLIKSADEIKSIGQAAEMTSQVMGKIKDSLTGEKLTENSIAAFIMKELITLGSELPATPPLIGVGKRATYGHPTWENYEINKNELVFLEFSGCVNRYHAPVMRSLCIGEPSSQARRFEQASREAVNSVIDNIRPGVPIEEIDHIVRQSFQKNKVEQYFHNRSGYSVGIGFTKWLDGISVKKGESTVLEPNMVFHIIPFLTDFEISVAISETILITDTGVKKLTNVAQDIIKIN